MKHSKQSFNPITPQKSSAQAPSLKLKQLNEKELQAIVGGASSANYNETLTDTVATPPVDVVSESAQLIELAEEDLAAITGAALGFNHNETLVV
ncbi:MAG: bacteriocin [Cyanobacteria bacterium P01_F01_bin.86]